MGSPRDDTLDLKHIRFFAPNPQSCLHYKTLVLLLLRHFLVKTKGIIKVENRVDVVREILERRVLSCGTAPHVVGIISTTTFIPNLKRSNDGENLPLGICWHGIPLGLRAQVGRRK